MSLDIVFRFSPAAIQNGVSVWRGCPRQPAESGPCWGRPDCPALLEFEVEQDPISIARTVIQAVEGRQPQLSWDDRCRSSGRNKIGIRFGGLGPKLSLPYSPAVRAARADGGGQKGIPRPTFGSFARYRLRRAML